jgi:hypothetical protein
MAPGIQEPKRARVLPKKHGVCLSDGGSEWDDASSVAGSVRESHHIHWDMPDDIVYEECNQSEQNDLDDRWDDVKEADLPVNKVCDKCRSFSTLNYECTFCEASFCEACYRKCVDTRCIYCTRNKEERDITDNEFLEILIEATGKEKAGLRQEIVRSIYDNRVHETLRCGKRLSQVLDSVLLPERQILQDDT